MEWTARVDKLILEMLYNRTPPTCIQANILAMARAFFSGGDIVKEIPCVKYIRNMRTTLLTITKTLAAYEIGNAKEVKQTHTDETSKRQASVLNVVNNILTQQGELRTICLAGDLMPPNGTAEEQSKAVVGSFAEGGRLMECWIAKHKKMFGGDDDLEEHLDLLPTKDRFCLTRLLGTYFSTDTCHTATSTQEKTLDLVLKAAAEKGITDGKELFMHFGNCHNHIRNIWVKALSNRMCVQLTQLLQHDLALIPPHLRITCDLYNIHR